MKLKTVRLILSEISFTDLESVHALHLLPEVDQYNTLGIPDSIDDTRTLMAKWMENQNSIPQVSYIFRIGLLNTGSFAGLIGLNLGKLNYKIAEVWYKIHPKYWGKGIATEALGQLLEFAFNDLKLHRIEAGCAVGNIASIKVLEKSGFKNEGRKREILPIRGVWTDNYFYAILEKDFLVSK